MERAEFEKLAEIYGGDLGRWPEDAAGDAAALAARDPSAEARLAEEAALDAALNATSAPEPRAEMFAAMEAGFRAVSDHRRRSAALEAAVRPAKTRRDGYAWFVRIVTRTLGDTAESIGGRGAFAGGVAMAAVAGLVIGVFGFDADAPSGEASWSDADLASEDAFFSEDDDAFAALDAEGWFISDEG